MLRRALTVALGLAWVLSAMAPPPRVAAATDKLPDLRAASIHDLRIQTTASGRRLLRFTGLFWNGGAGPFETRAARTSTGAPWDVDQIVYDTAGGSRRIQTNAELRYAGDGHDHWHVRHVLSYHLWGPKGTLADAKIGFCFFDTNLIDGDLPGSPAGSVYHESSCGSKGSLSTRNGISVGWGDKYPWNFAYQWIDISGVAGGTYTLRTAVDLYHEFTETTRANDCAWARISFTKTGSTVKVLDRGSTCINDHDGTPYAADVDWVMGFGISQGCDADMFCTNNAMTRGLAVSYLVKALKLPATTTDYYTDDETNPHEANINKAAAAGITTGCAPTRFCPTTLTNRGQVAVFFDRALDLPSTALDFFDDDDGTATEAAINRVAAAGYVTGCGIRRYCPSSTITRGQMVRMLHRAFS